MTFLIFLIIHITYLISYTRCVSVIINTTSSFSFPQRVLKAEVATINASEFSFILFANGSISQLDSALVHLRTIATNDNKKIVDFSLCNTQLYATNTPVIIAVVDGRAEWKVISLLNPALQHSNLQFSGIVSVFGEGADFNSTALTRFRGSVYFQDEMRQLSISGGVTSTLASKNFTTGLLPLTRQMVVKVVAVRHQSTDFLLSVTSSKKLSSFNCSGSVFNHEEPQTSLLGLLATVEDLLHDRESVALATYSDNTRSAHNMLSQTAVSFSSAASTALNGLFLKAVRPRYDQDGDRVFVGHSRLVRLGLASNLYSSGSVVQSGLPFAGSAKLGFAVFQAGSRGSFVYEENAARVYAYCESMLNDSCGSDVRLPCTLRLGNCESCNDDLTICQVCASNHLLINNTCHKIVTSCSVANCIECLVNSTCLSCSSPNTLNMALNECM